MDPTTEAPATQATGEGGPSDVAAEGAQVQNEYSGPFAAALEAVPNGADAVREALSNIESKLGQRFQDHAEYRKGWEPFDPLRDAISEYGPDGVQQLLALGEMVKDPTQATSIISDPDSFRELWQAWGEHLGYQGQSEQQPGEQPGGGEEIPPWAQEIIDWKQQQEQASQTEAQERQQAEADKAFEQAMQELSGGEHADLFKRGEDDKPTPVEQGVAGHAALLIGNGVPIADAVKKGMELVQQIRGQGQTDLVREKLRQPEPAVRGGGADTRPKRARTFDEAEARVDERLGVA